MSTTVTLPRGGLKRRGVVVTGRLLGRRPRWWWLGLLGAACLGATAPAQAAPITVVCAICAQPPAPPFVYVTNFGDGTVSEFGTAVGGLAPLSAAPVLAGDRPGAVAVTPDGTNVYVTNRGDNTVSEYDVAADGTLTPKLGPGCKPVSTSTCTPLTVATGRFPFGIAVTPDGKSVYVTNASDNTVSQYRVGAGEALSAKTPKAVAAGRFPVGVAVSPDGNSVYVTNGADNTLSQYTIGAGGALRAKTPATVAAGRFPSGIAVSPDGGSVYVTNQGDGTVSQYDVGAVGALTAKTPMPVAAGKSPRAIVVSPDGHGVYVTNTFDNTVSQYSVGAGGALSAKTSPTVATGSEPQGIAVSPDSQSVYVTEFNNTFGRAVFQYGVGAGGTLSAKTPATVATGGAPVGIAVGPAQLRFPCASVIIACNARIQQGRSSVRITGTIVRANTAQGILVERIIGGRRVRVGRVPFGPHPAGRLRIRWDLRVNGHKLPRGRYLITLRVFDHHQHLIAAAHPVQINVH